MMPPRLSPTTLPIPGECDIAGLRERYVRHARRLARDGLVGAELMARAVKAVRRELDEPVDNLAPELFDF